MVLSLKILIDPVSNCSLKCRSGSSRKSRKRLFGRMVRISILRFIPRNGVVVKKIGEAVNVSRLFSTPNVWPKEPPAFNPKQWSDLMYTGGSESLDVLVLRVLIFSAILFISCVLFLISDLFAKKSFMNSRNICAKCVMDSDRFFPCSSRIRQSPKVNRRRVSETRKGFVAKSQLKV